jgi:hypothetical protein
MPGVPTDLDLSPFLSDDETMRHRLPADGLDKGIMRLMNPVDVWRRVHGSLVDRHGKPIPLWRNYALHYALAGDVCILAGLVLLLFLQPAGLALILFGLLGYAFSALYHFFMPTWLYPRWPLKRPPRDPDHSGEL